MKHGTGDRSVVSPDPEAVWVPVDLNLLEKFPFPGFKNNPSSSFPQHLPVPKCPLLVHTTGTQASSGDRFSLLSAG